MWPENHQAFNLFRSLSTQWRVGACGITGLDYGPMYHKMDRMDLTESEYEQLENDMQTLEVEALTVINKKD